MYIITRASDEVAKDLTLCLPDHTLLFGNYFDHPSVTVRMCTHIREDLSDEEQTYIILRFGATIKQGEDWFLKDFLSPLDDFLKS